MTTGSVSLGSRSSTKNRHLFKVFFVQIRGLPRAASAGASEAGSQREAIENLGAGLSVRLNARVETLVQVILDHTDFGQHSIHNEAKVLKAIKYYFNYSCNHHIVKTVEIESILEVASERSTKILNSHELTPTQLLTSTIYSILFTRISANI